MFQIKFPFKILVNIEQLKKIIAANLYNDTIGFTVKTLQAGN
ncbi:hypothetical protein QWZ08_07725 [Ferruginibacter paludis]|nr:hypothetical protein [Ferruginibacter paludis]MDN3655509.1 hypothetical protein [Ferruginibacter paludis]